MITCEFFFQPLVGLNPKPSEDCLTRLGKLFVQESLLILVLALLKSMKACALVLC